MRRSRLLLVVTNFAILIVLSTAMRLLGIEPYLTAYGVNYQSLLIFALVFGMGGSFISLALSKWTAKRISGAQVIKEPVKRDGKVAGQDRVRTGGKGKDRHARGRRFPLR